ncbi:MAG TPA: TonB-dependent receptor, partial [Ideonella sp.]|nr:TonB-dependent receptor [Ideonella sp.]
RFGGGQASASLGSRIATTAGDWSWWINVNRLESDSQPLVYATRSPSTAAAAPGATPVTGAVLERNRFNQDWLLLGTTNQAHTTQDHAKLKLAWQATPTLRASYTLGWWGNEVERQSQTWLRDESGARIAFGPQSYPSGGTLPVSIAGKAYTLSAADFPQTREQLSHLMQGLSVKSLTRGSWDWEAAASLYDYRRDQVRAWAPVATTTSTDADSGRLTDQSGTGWNTLALKGIWRPQGEGGAHIAEFGLQREAFQLRTRVFATGEWTAGDATGAATSRFEGDTRLTSLWAQDAWRFAPDWSVVLGLRAEDWRASDGLTATASADHRHPDRQQQALSPKLALGYQVDDALALRLSTGRALRFPTVSELYQGALDASGKLQNGNPELKPERSWTSELSAEWTWPKALWRATLFFEATRDALYSQTNTTVTPNVTNIQNVDHIRTTGLELAAQGRDLWVAGLDLSGSLTYTDSVIVANAAFPASVGQLQPRVPRWRANLLATWRSSERLSSTLGLRFAAHQFGTLDNTDPNGDRYQGISDFLVADLRVRYEFTRQWSAAVGVDNLNNQTYWNFHPYPQRTWLAELKFDL